MISIRNLHKSFGDKVLFENYNMEIPDGSFVVISGDSGCGKSTLLNAIGGIESPDKGKITVDGYCVAEKHKLFVQFKKTWSICCNKYIFDDYFNCSYFLCILLCGSILHGIL